MADLPRFPRIIDLRTAADAGPLDTAPFARAELDLLIQPDLFWFQGHFPNFPILPGVIQLDWALDFAGRYLGLTVPVTRQFQVKYKSGIFAGDRVTLILTHTPAKNRLNFDYVRDGAVCSTGQLVLPS